MRASPAGMFVRFVSNIPDPENDNEPLGLFHVASWIRDRPETPASVAARLEALRAWFNENLEQPSRFNRSRRAHRREKAIAWFRESAQESIDRAREVADLVGKQGYVIREVRTSRPGYVVYEDAFQVVAEPFSDTPR